MAETPDMEAVIAKIKKLLALGQNNDNEHQAAAAMAKVQELLEAYNLDMSALGSSGKGAQRSDTTKKGGLYSWQRKLWEAVATLNFCYYVSLKGLQKGAVYEHRLIGSHANVVATEVMAKYLQETIERLAQRWAKDTGYSSVFVREAIAYREGMSARIVDRLHERRASARGRAQARRGTDRCCPEFDRPHPCFGDKHRGRLQQRLSAGLGNGHHRQEQARARTAPEGVGGSQRRKAA